MSDTPITDALASSPRIKRRDVPTRVWRQMARFEREHGELIEMLGRCESKLRAIAAEFNSPYFTDRYGDGPQILNLAVSARALLKRLEQEESCQK